MTTRVLLTGGAGFVGRQILRALAERGAEVHAVLRRSGSLVERDAACVARTSFTDDLFAERAAWWALQLEGVDVVVHSAWYAEPGKYLQSEHNLDCLIGTVEMARGASQAGVRRIIGLGSCAEYEVGDGDIDVNRPLRPQSPYAAAKAATYLALSGWLPTIDVQFAWCRLFYLYGEGEDGRRLVPYLRARLAAGERAELSAGTQVRDFLDVREAGERIADVSLGTTVGAVNVCSGVPVTVRALAERIADEFGRRDLLAFGARPENAFDPQRVVGVPTLVTRAIA